MTESERRRAEKAWNQRNSDGRATNTPPPARILTWSEEVIGDGELAAGHTIVMERHVKEWSVPEPEEA